MRYEDVLILRDKVTETTKKIAKNFKNVQKEGKNTQKTLQMLGSIGKKAMSGIAIGVTAVYGATLSMIQKTAEYGDQVDDMSKRIGISAKAYQEWNFILSQNGGNVDSLQMGMKALANQLDGITKGSKDSLRYFKKIGVNVKDNTGHFRKQEDIFNDVIRGLQKIPNETDRAIIANKLFGRSANDLKAILSLGTAEMEAQRKEAHRLGLVLTDEQIETAGKLADTWEKTKMVGSGIGYEVVAKYLGQINEFLDEVVGHRDEAVNVIQTIIDGVIKIGKGIYKAFQTWGGIMGNFWGFLLYDVPTYFELNWRKVYTFFAVFAIRIGKTIDKIKEKLQPLMNAISTVSSGFQNVSLGGATQAGGRYSNVQKTTTTNTNYYQNQNTLNFNGTIREEADIDKIGHQIVAGLIQNNLNRGGAY